MSGAGKDKHGETRWNKGGSAQCFLRDLVGDFLALDAEYAA